MTRTIISAPAPARRLANLLLIPIALFGGFGLLGATGGAPVGTVLVLLLPVPAYVALSWRMRRLGIFITETDLVVRNPFRTAVIPLTQVRRVGIDLQPGGGVKRTLFIEPLDDRDVWVYCTWSGRRSAVTGTPMMTESQLADAHSHVQEAVAAAGSS